MALTAAVAAMAAKGDAIPLRSWDECVLLEAVRSSLRITQEQADAGRLTQPQLQELASSTAGFSGSDLAVLVESAKMDLSICLRHPASGKTFLAPGHWLS